MFGVRCLCGIHIIYSGAVIRGDRQGLYLYGKSEASRCGTHLLKAGSPFVEVRHRRIFLNITPIFGHKKRTVSAVLFVLLLRYYGVEKQILFPRVYKTMLATLGAVMAISCG